MKLNYSIVVALWGLCAPAGSTAQEVVWTPERAEDPRSQGWSEEGLGEARALAESFGTAALLVVADDVTVLSLGDLTHRFRAHSLRKSLLSSLYGIAVHRGEIDLEATLESLGVDDTPPLTPTERTATVLQLMEATSGVYHAAASETAEMRASRPRRGSHAPGAHWHYNNWDFNALGSIYSQQLQVPVGEAFAAEVAAPLGMEDFSANDVRYQLEAENSEHPSYKFRISARDLTRFGLLYLHGGRWGARQILPPDWVADSTRLRSRTGESGTKSGYGLMWWVTAPGDHGLPEGSFTASGTGGQRLSVLPSIGTVVVHLMDTDDPAGPRIATSSYNELLRVLLAARTR